MDSSVNKDFATQQKVFLCYRSFPVEWIEWFENTNPDWSTVDTQKMRSVPRHFGTQLKTNPLRNKKNTNTKIISCVCVIVGLVVVVGNFQSHNIFSVGRAFMYGNFPNTFVEYMCTSDAILMRLHQRLTSNWRCASIFIIVDQTRALDYTSAIAI